MTSLARLFFLIPNFIVPQISSISLTVHTRNFDVRGILSRTVQGKNVYAYLGVPYGKSPIGHLRYRAPQPITRWQGNVNGTQLAKTCYSATDRAFPGFRGSEMWNPPTELAEDCLNLNIWVPADVPDSRVKLPVVVWIFGGGFYSGSPSLDLYNGAILATENNVIVVNINYRLGPFGFLYLGEGSSIQGNMGLLDQQLALRWINGNIEAFGGNSKDVSLFGESAGAASVSSHLIAPGSAKFFQKVFLQSGSIINQWAHVSPAIMIRRTKRIAELLNCDVEKAEIENIAECLRGKTASETQTAAEQISNNEQRFLEFPFVPIDKDGSFFTETFSDSLSRGTFKKCPVIIGLVADESTFWLPYYLPDIIKFDPSLPKGVQKNLLTRTEYLQAVNTTFRDYFPPILCKAVAFHYSDDLKIAAKGRPEESFRNSVGHMVGDYFFNCDVIRFAEILAEHGSNVYFYQFAQRSSTNPWPLWMGTMHGYEIEYFFGVPLRTERAYSRKEVTFSKKMMKYWINFAKYGFPSEDGRSRPWPRFTVHDRTYLVLSAENSRVLSHLKSVNCQFWSEVKSANRRLQNNHLVSNAVRLGAMHTFLFFCLLFLCDFTVLFS